MAAVSSRVSSAPLSGTGNQPRGVGGQHVLHGIHLGRFGAPKLSKPIQVKAGKEQKTDVRLFVPNWGIRATGGFSFSTLKITHPFSRRPQK